MTESYPAAVEDSDAGAVDEPDPVDLSGEPAQSRLARALGRLPYLLSSRPIIVFGILPVWKGDPTLYTAWCGAAQPPRASDALLCQAYGADMSHIGIERPHERDARTDAIGG